MNMLKPAKSYSLDCSDVTEMFGTTFITLRLMCVAKFGTQKKELYNWGLGVQILPQCLKQNLGVSTFLLDCVIHLKFGVSA
jgi:hypothetical protein